MADILGSIGLHRDNRGDIEIVAVGFVAILIIPGGTIAGTEIQQIGLGVVNDRVPDGAEYDECVGYCLLMTLSRVAR